MRRVDRSGRRAAVLFAVFSLFVSRAQAEEVVFVSFEFGESSIAKRFGDTLPTTEREMTDWLVGKLNTHYPYWNYQRAAAETDVPRLSVSLKHVAPDWMIVVALQPTAGQPARAAREVVWMNRVEVERTGLPARSAIPPSIKQKIEKQVLDDAVGRMQLFEALHSKVPIVRDVRLASPSAPRAVLALDWSRHWRLGLSDFTVHYQTPRGVAEVTCSGVGAQLVYPSPPPASGLLVQLQEFKLGGGKDPASARLADLLAAKPLAVYLTRFDDRADLLLSPNADGGVPSVAPPR